MCLQVAATSRLAAYTAKAVAGCPSENVGAAVSAAVAALAHNAAGATAVQDESATAAAVAAAAAAVEAVSKATGLKRQRTVLSLDTARAAKVWITAYWVLWFECSANCLKVYTKSKHQKDMQECERR